MSSSSSLPSNQSSNFQSKSSTCRSKPLALRAKLPRAWVKSECPKKCDGAACLKIYRVSVGALAGRRRSSGSPESLEPASRPSRQVATCPQELHDVRASVSVPVRPSYACMRAPMVPTEEDRSGIRWKIAARGRRVPWENLREQLAGWKGIS
ncbi:hypothetical protein KM043_005857 [Ampulex compressa]|nr:hypothetical protein KM043_005857 [Ampulex compressa]